MTGPILTDTGEYRPIPDTGIGLTLEWPVIFHHPVYHDTTSSAKTSDKISINNKLLPAFHTVMYHENTTNQCLQLATNEHISDIH